MHTDALKTAVNSFKNNNELIGGWEEQLKQKIHVTDEDKILLKRIELTQIERTRAKNKRQIEDVRNDMIETLMRFVNERFKMGDELTDCGEPFIHFSADVDVIRNVQISVWNINTH